MQGAETVIASSPRSPLNWSCGFAQAQKHGKKNNKLLLEIQVTKLKILKSVNKTLQGRTTKSRYQFMHTR